ncbi:ankyrin repeat-containing domain protein [Fusarium venenatum]|uniref:ankyrin repeat-containing domain protein n=1 Tax=Fusarium venenatum TaxID=56646 RepID=UPI001DBA911E|nr:ankyrin repeat-containing domain protein [Fusarium venenatum]
MLLLDLPNELLNYTANFLESERNISAFSQANRCLHELLTPHLYRHNAQCSGSSALLWAVENWQNNMDSDGRTPLSWAAAGGHGVLVEFLVEQGVELGYKDGYGQTALLLASGNGHEVTVKLLIKQVADPASCDNYGRTSLSWAVENGHAAMVTVLLGYKVDPCSMNRYGSTILA